MDPFKDLVDRVREVLAAKAPEFAADIADDLRRNVERLPSLCKHAEVMRIMGLIDGSNKVTAEGIKVYNALLPYYDKLNAEERKGKEDEARKKRIQTSPGYTTLDGRWVPPLQYDPDKFPDS